MGCRLDSYIRKSKVKSLTLFTYILLSSYSQSSHLLRLYSIALKVHFPSGSRSTPWNLSCEYISTFCCLQKTKAKAPTLQLFSDFERLTGRYFLTSNISIWWDNHKITLSPKQWEHQSHENQAQLFVAVVICDLLINKFQNKCCWCRRVVEGD